MNLNCNHYRWLVIWNLPIYLHDDDDDYHHHHHVSGVRHLWSDHHRSYFSSPRIYEHGEPWWNDINRGKFLIHPPELSGNPTKSSSSKAGGTGKVNDAFCLTKYLSHALYGSLTCRKTYWHGTNGFTSPPKVGMLRICITLYGPLGLKGLIYKCIQEDLTHVTFSLKQLSYGKLTL
jgi:hypothetical protein